MIQKIYTVLRKHMEDTESFLAAADVYRAIQEETQPQPKRRKVRKTEKQKEEGKTMIVSIPKPNGEARTDAGQ